jgi:hypothetical protein
MLRVMLRPAVAGCIGVAVVALAKTPVVAQINAATLTSAGVVDCIAEAIATNAVDGDGSVVIFSCTAAKARTLYNFLGRKIRAELVQERNGKFESRAFGSGACYHHIEDSDGKAADEFRCDLILSVGEAPGE